MKCFTADFSQFCSANVEIDHLDGRLTISKSNPSISEISLKFPDFLRSSVRKLVYSAFADNNLLHFH